MDRDKETSWRRKRSFVVVFVIEENSRIIGVVMFYVTTWQVLQKKRKEKREREKKTNTTRREWNGKRKMNRGWNPVRIFSGPFQKETKEFFPSASFQAAIREDDIRNDPRVMRPHRSAPPSPPLSSPRPNVTLSFDRSLNYFLVVI